MDEKILRIEKELDSLGLEVFSCKANVTRKAVNPVIKPLDSASYLEYSSLKPNASQNDVIGMCFQAKQFNFRAVCVHSLYVEEAKKYLEGSEVLVGSVVGFPLGMTSTEIKLAETKYLIAIGVDEIDMVMPVGLLKDRKYSEVYHDIRAVVAVADTIPVKVILETCLLEDMEKVIACLIAKRSGAAFVKTSTGFSEQGATVENVKLMREVIGNDMGIKAAAGIKDFRFAKELIEAGANAIGTSSALTIIAE